MGSCRSLQYVQPTRIYQNAMSLMKSYGIYIVLGDGIFAPLPDIHTIMIEEIWNWNQQHTQTSEDSQGPVDAKVGVERYRNFHL